MVAPPACVVDAADAEILSSDASSPWSPRFSIDVFAFGSGEPCTSSASSAGRTPVRSRVFMSVNDRPSMASCQGGIFSRHGNSWRLLDHAPRALTCESLSSRSPTPVRGAMAIRPSADARTRGERADTAGDSAAQWGLDKGCALTGRMLVPDDTTQIVSALAGWCDGDAADLILTTGGTGLGPRDVT